MTKIILPLLLLASCVSNDKDTSTKQTEAGIYTVTETKIDYCEYIIVQSYNGISIIHKANCANDFHRPK